MNVKLDSVEVRILGCLIEKEMSTPDYYPLSLNALVNACNQKSNRDPVMELGESDVQRTLDALIARHLVSAKSSSGSRVPKYAHRLSNPITKTLDFSPQELAVLCELFLRGPQTAGELRGHAARLTEFADIAQVEAVLQRLRERDDGPCVIELPRQPGRREVRYAHLFGDVPAQESQPAEAPQRAAAPAGRVEALEQEVNALREEIAALRRQLENLLRSVTGQGGAEH
jgi:hypothetical protein